jgi:plasmid stabilization system protein ParE
MAIEIDWSPEAEETFDQNIKYLQEEWTEREAKIFVQQTQKVIRSLEHYPESYPQGNKNKKYRKARLNKYIVLFYRYYKTKGVITLITFWNVKQNPVKLKY